jgi:dynein heavy chain
VEENVDKVKAALRVIKTWRETYVMHRNKLEEYFTDGKAIIKWEFATSLVFERLDKFLDRVETVSYSFCCSPLFVWRHTDPLEILRPSRLVSP